MPLHVVHQVVHVVQYDAQVRELVNICEFSITDVEVMWVGIRETWLLQDLCLSGSDKPGMTIGICHDIQ